MLFSTDYILFSDNFVDDFATLGKGNDELFWIRVKEAFSEPNPIYDVLDYLSDDVFAGQGHIVDPGKIHS